jgi:hypothetical protein
VIPSCPVISSPLWFSKITLGNPMLLSGRKFSKIGVQFFFKPLRVTK